MKNAVRRELLSCFLIQTVKTGFAANFFNGYRDSEKWQARLEMDGNLNFMGKRNKEISH